MLFTAAREHVYSTRRDEVFEEMTQKDTSTSGDRRNESKSRIVADENEVVLVWKISKKSLNREPFSEKGIFPTGELMAVCETVEKADSHIQMLRENSPSDRFGDSMDDAPYEFTTSIPTVNGRDS